MSVDNPDNGDAKPETETPTELRKMKTNACMPNNMTQNAVVQPLLTGLFLSLLFIFIYQHTAGQKIKKSPGKKTREIK